MIEVFGLEEGCEAAKLYECYTTTLARIEALDVQQQFRDIFTTVVNEAYDNALHETQEAKDAVTSPRREK